MPQSSSRHNPLSQAFGKLLWEVASLVSMIKGLISGGIKFLSKARNRLSPRVRELAKRIEDGAGEPKAPQKGQPDAKKKPAEVEAKEKLVESKPRGHGKKGYYPERGTIPLTDGELVRLNMKCERVVTAEVANKLTPVDLTGKWLPPFAKGYEAMEVVTTDTTRLVRVGTKDKWISGEYYARLEDIKGMSGREIQEYLNLDFVPDYFQHVTIPKGQRLYVGTVGKQPNLKDKKGNLFGLNEDGGLQFQIKLGEGQQIDDFREWFTKWDPLELL